MRRWHKLHMCERMREEDAKACLGPTTCSLLTPITPYRRPMMTALTPDGRALFPDGSEERVDAVIYCTGVWCRLKCL